MVSRASGLLLAQVAAVLLLGSACPRRDEALREAWALWLEYEPTCTELLDEAQVEVLTPRWRLALEALAAETLSAMEEQLVAAAGSGGRQHDLLVDLVAGSRRICSLARGEPVPALASTLARARSDVAVARSRLAIAMAMSDEEAFQRANRHAGRLSEAISRALERAPVLDRGEEGAPNRTEARDSGRSSPRGPPATSRLPEGEMTKAEAPVDRARRPLGRWPSSDESRDGRERIEIRSSSGESWAELRQRRRQEMTQRVARWRPLYRDGMRTLTELRRELRATLEHETLAGASRLCTRLGQAAGAVPSVVIAQAPDPRIAGGLQALVDAYVAAGAACADGQPVRAWGLITEGDRHWRTVGRHLESLVTTTPLPLSLRQSD